LIDESVFRNDFRLGREEEKSSDLSLVFNL